MNPTPETPQETSAGQPAEVSLKSQLTQWRTEQLGPWKAEVQKLEAQLTDNNARLKQNIPSLQSLVALLLENKPKKAVKVWNSLGLQPSLKSLKLHDKTETVTFYLSDGETIAVTLDVLLAELQAFIIAA